MQLAGSKLTPEARVALADAAAAAKTLDELPASWRRWVQQVEAELEEWGTA